MILGEALRAEEGDSPRLVGVGEGDVEEVVHLGVVGVSGDAHFVPEGDGLGIAGLEFDDGFAGGFRRRRDRF